MDHSHHHHHHSKPDPKPAEVMQPAVHAGTHEHKDHGQEKNQDHYNKHAGHHTANFLQRFWISLILTIPVLLLSEMIQHWLNFHIPFKGSPYLLFTLSTIIYLYGGWPFLKGMVNEIRHNAIGMMTLVA